jgi:hypothetical protein
LFDLESRFFAPTRSIARVDARRSCQGWLSRQPFHETDSLGAVEAPADKLWDPCICFLAFSLAASLGDWAWSFPVVLAAVAIRGAIGETPCLFRSAAEAAPQTRCARLNLATFGRGLSGPAFGRAVCLGHWRGRQSPSNETRGAIRSRGYGHSWPHHPSSPATSQRILSSRGQGELKRRTRPNIAGSR